MKSENNLEGKIQNEEEKDIKSEEEDKKRRIIEKI